MRLFFAAFSRPASACPSDSVPQGLFLPSDGKRYGESKCQGEKKHMKQPISFKQADCKPVAPDPSREFELIFETILSIRSGMNPTGLLTSRPKEQGRV